MLHTLTMAVIPIIHACTRLQVAIKSKERLTRVPMFSKIVLYGYPWILQKLHGYFRNVWEKAIVKSAEVNK